MNYRQDFRRDGDHNYRVVSAQPRNGWTVTLGAHGPSALGFAEVLRRERCGSRERAREVWREYCALAIAQGFTPR